MNYISLFSASGIGCYGFKEQGYNCIATNEFLSKRLGIQKHNNKCKFDREGEKSNQAQIPKCGRLVWVAGKI